MPQITDLTGVAFTGVLKREDVGISMDGLGRALDNFFVGRLWRNVKYAGVYLDDYASMGDLNAEMTRYFASCNCERPQPGVELSDVPTWWTLVVRAVAR